MSKNIQLPSILIMLPPHRWILELEKISSHLKMDGVFGNPASRSTNMDGGRRGCEKPITCRKLGQCDPREIVWTSGATEAITSNKGVANFYNVRANNYYIKN